MKEEVIKKIKSNSDGVFQGENREIIVPMKNSSILIQKKIPKSILKVIEDQKDYAMTKLYLFMSEHSTGLQDIYDIFITFDKNIIKHIKSKENVEFGSYTIKKKYNDKRFYLSKKIFKDFVYYRKKTILLIRNKKNNDLLNFYLDEEIYNDFLLKNIGITNEKINNIKENAHKGISEYFSWVREFIKAIFSNQISFEDTNKLFSYYKEVRTLFTNINLNDLCFDDMVKRAKFSGKIKIFFIDDKNIIISRDLELRIPEIIDFLREEVNLFLNRAIKQFYNNNILKIRNGTFRPPNKENVDRIIEILAKFKLISLEKYDVLFFEDMLQNFSILEKCKSIINAKCPEIKKIKVDFEALKVFLSIFTSIQKFIPYCDTKEYLIKIAEKSLNISFERELFTKIMSLSSNLIYLYNVADDLKAIQSELTNKFENLAELKTMVDLSYFLVREVFTRRNVPHNSLSIAAFSMLLIGLDLHKKIRLYTITDIESIKASPYSVNIEVYKIIDIANNKNNYKFNEYKITKRQKEIRKALIDILVASLITAIKSMKSESQITLQLEQLFYRINFFKQYEFFKSELTRISKELDSLKEFLKNRKFKIPDDKLKYIKKITKKKASI